jgi:DNA-binding MarR family transcriptional regulator
MFSTDPAINVGFLLHDVSRLMRATFDERAQSLGMTRAQWRVLMHLAKREGLNQRALAEILEIDNVSLGRHIDRLERDGWLERRPDPADRRAWLIYLSDAAGPTLKKMENIATAMQSDALSGLSQEDLARLTDMLMLIKENLTEADADDTARPKAASG